MIEPSKEAMEAARKLVGDVSFGQLAYAIVGATEQQQRRKVLADLEFALARLLDSFAAKARLEEAKWWRRWPNF